MEPHRHRHRPYSVIAKFLFLYYIGIPLSCQGGILKNSQDNTRHLTSFLRRPHRGITALFDFSHFGKAAIPFDPCGNLPRANHCPTGALVAHCGAPPCSIPRTSARLPLSFDPAGISRGLAKAPLGLWLRTAVRRPVQFLALRQGCRYLLTRRESPAG